MGGKNDNACWIAVVAAILVLILGVVVLVVMTKGEIAKEVKKTGGIIKDMSGCGLQSDGWNCGGDLVFKDCRPYGLNIPTLMICNSAEREGIVIAEYKGKN